MELEVLIYLSKNHLHCSSLFYFVRVSYLTNIYGLATYEVHFYQISLIVDGILLCHARAFILVRFVLKDEVS